MRKKKNINNTLFPLAMAVFGFVTLLFYLAYIVYDVFLCWFYTPDVFKEAVRFFVPIIVYVVAVLSFSFGLKMYGERKYYNDR